METKSADFLEQDSAQLADSPIRDWKTGSTANFKKASTSSSG